MTTTTMETILGQLREGDKAYAMAMPLAMFMSRTPEQLMSTMMTLTGYAALTVTSNDRVGHHHTLKAKLKNATGNIPMLQQALRRLRDSDAKVRLHLSAYEAKMPMVTTDIGEVTAYRMTVVIATSTQRLRQYIEDEIRQSAEARWKQWTKEDKEAAIQITEQLHAFSMISLT